MKNRETIPSNLKEKLNKLTPKGKQELIAYLKSSYSIFDEHAQITTCRHCGSDKIVKNGKRANGTHKYICRTCKKHFTYRTNTVLSGVQKLNQWNDFVEDFMSLNMSSLKQIKKQIGISEQTAFNWRHKLLSALAVNMSNISFKDEIIEFDDTNFLISRKGRQSMNIDNKRTYRKWRRSQIGESPYNAKVFVTFGRESKKLDFYLASMGRVHKVNLASYFKIPKKFKNIEVYCDKHVSYKGFFNDNDIKFKSFVSKYHRDWIDKDVHNQNINSYISQLKNFTNGYLHGVSLKYLNNYLKWFVFIHETKLFVNKKMELDTKMEFNIVDRICDEVVNDKRGLDKYRRAEYNFTGFLKQNGRSNFGECKNHYYKTAV